MDINKHQFFVIQHAMVRMGFHVFFFNRPKQGLSEIKATIDVQLKIVDHSEDMAVSAMLVIDTLNFGVTTRTLW